MKNVAYVYHPDYLLHIPPFEHPESPDRLIAINQHLESVGLLGTLVPVNPDYPDNGEILRVHDPDYLRKLELACRRGDLTLDSGDTYLNKNSYSIALLSAAGAIAGAEAVATGKADRAFCAVRPPGHHADRSEGMGFCLLNNAAITARYLQARHGVSKVMIIDWDVHHGNGTQSIFYEDPSVFFFSIHENPAFLYPGTGRRWETGKGAGVGTTLNAPMAPGAGDDEYRLAFEQLVAPAAERFRPEVLILSAGFDAHRDDPLADIQLTEEGFRFLSRFTIELANRFCGGKIVSLLEGGYERESLTRCTEIHIRELQKD
ncbi:MAG: histone deacetylase superfamily protein [Deltaproteobacteria bacterium CSP1-8]|nr:MAG: histone deacetylase superfamily protein [Deltaproteobacteria bacterium CSP1-8]